MYHYPYTPPICGASKTLSDRIPTASGNPNCVAINALTADQSQHPAHRTKRAMPVPQWHTPPPRTWDYERADRGPTPVVRKNTLAAKRAIVATLATRKAENVDQSDSSIPFAAAPEDTPVLVKIPHLTTLLSSLRRQSSPADTHDEDHPESAWPSPDIPRESDVVVFAAAPAGRLRLWKPWSQARMWPCLAIVGFPLF